VGSRTLVDSHASAHNQVVDPEGADALDVRLADHGLQRDVYAAARLEQAREEDLVRILGSWDLGILIPVVITSDPPHD